MAANRKPSQFKQCDVARALRATKAAGLDVARVDVHASGDFSVIIRGGEGQISGPQAPSPFDKWKAAKDARKA